MEARLVLVGVWVVVGVAFGGCACTAPQGATEARSASTPAKRSPSPVEGADEAREPRLSFADKDPCEMLSDAEVVALVGEPVERRYAKLSDGARECRLTASTGRSARLEVHRTLSVDLAEGEKGALAHHEATRTRWETTLHGHGEEIRDFDARAFLFASQAGVEVPMVRIGIARGPRAVIFELSDPQGDVSQLRSDVLDFAATLVTTLPLKPPAEET